MNAIFKGAVMACAVIVLAACGGGGDEDEGICNVPTDIAKDGSLCGDRAASVKPGGK